MIEITKILLSTDDNRHKWDVKTEQATADDDDADNEVNVTDCHDCYGWIDNRNQASRYNLIVCEKRAVWFKSDWNNKQTTIAV